MGTSLAPTGDSEVCSFGAVSVRLPGVASAEPGPHPVPGRFSSLPPMEVRMLGSRLGRAGIGLAALALAALSVNAASSTTAAVAAAPLFHPNVSDYAQVSASETPPTQAQCNSVSRRCFNPASTRAAYNVNPLYR